MLIQAPEGTNLDRLEAASADASPDHFAPRGEVTAVDTLDVRTPGKLCAPSSAKGAAGPRW